VLRGLGAAVAALVALACGGEPRAGFERVVHLRPVHVDPEETPGGPAPGGALRVHGGEARRAWRARQGRPLVQAVDVPAPGSSSVAAAPRLELSVARAGAAGTGARIRITTAAEDAEPGRGNAAAGRDGTRVAADDAKGDSDGARAGAAEASAEGPDAAPGVVWHDALEAAGWQRVSVDLAPWVGRSITIHLEATPAETAGSERGGARPGPDATGADATAGSEPTAGRGAAGSPGPRAVDWGEPLLLARGDAPGPPNILLVTLDTTRADVAADVRVAPHLAALARRGVAYTDAWSAATSTTPGHASILTGLAVDRHGAVSNRSTLAPHLETLAEALAARGLQTAATVTVDHVGPEAGFGQGFGRFRPARAGDASDGAASVAVAERWLADFAAPGARPFFLWVHLFDPHTPYGPPADFVRGELAARGLALPPPRVDPPTVPIFPGPLPTPLAWLEGITSRAHVDALYRAGVAYADHLVGRLLGRIEALGLAQRTLVCVTADHGEALGEQGVFYQHAGLWPATLRVPLIVAGPGWPSGETSDVRVHTTDVFATLVAAVEDRLSEAPLRRALTEPEPGRRVWFAESRLAQLGFRDDAVHFAHALGPGQFGVLLDERADGPHVRAIQRYAPGASWLFDVNRDPALDRNLAGDAGTGVARYRALVRERARDSAPRARHRTLDPEDEARLRALGYTEE